MLEALARGPATAGELAALLPIARPGVSRHLRVLREAGLVDVRQEAQRRIYSLHPEPLETRRIGRHERGQRLTAPAPLQRTEHEQPVGHDRSPHAAAELVLRVPLVEGRLRHAAPGEVPVA